MLRIGRRVTVLTFGLAVLAGACSDDGGSADEPSSTTATTESTSPTALPRDPDPGAGSIVVDGEPATLIVTSCVRDQVDGGITTVLRLDAIDGSGSAVVVGRQRTEGGSLKQPTVTDVVTSTRGDEVVEAQRVQVGARVIDLRDPAATKPLIEIDGDVVRAEGTFGPPGTTAGDPANVDGSLVARCPA